MNLTEHNFPIEHEHEVGDVAEDENPQRPGPLSRVDAQFRVRWLEKLLYTVWCFTRGLSLSTPSFGFPAFRRCLQDLSAQSDTLTYVQQGKRDALVQGNRGCTHA